MQTNQVTRLAQLVATLHGLSTEFAGVASIKMGGEDVPTADLTKIVQEEVDAIKAGVAAKAAYVIAVDATKKARAKAEPLRRLLKRVVVAQCGDTQKSADVLAAFGFVPRKVSVKTLEQKQAAAAKAKATRAARHTMGSKQKAKIQGVVPPVAAPVVNGVTNGVTNGVSNGGPPHA